MAIAEGQISKQNSSYRQGLVLGLTMAEIMLLLVFCLLIAMATFILKEQKRSQAAENKVKELLADNKRNEDLVQALSKNDSLVEKIKAVAGSNDPQAIDQHWRELVEGRAAADELKRSGMSLTELRERIEQIKTLDANGIKVDQAIQDANAIAAINRVLAKPGDAPLSTQAIIEALKRTTPIGGSPGHLWPPIISLSEADGNFFKSGSAELSQPFRESLQTTIPNKVLKYIKEYDVDVVEVVGHTDEQPLGVHQSNLDRDLLPVLKGKTEIGKLVPADNAGLGLARAVSVVSVLKQSPELANYKILPLSGAQLVNTDETLATEGIPASIQQRRRIEIRLRKSSAREATATISPPAPARVPAVPPRPVRAPVKPRPPASPAPISLLPRQPSPAPKPATPPVSRPSPGTAAVAH
ncbi:OmpA family protein [Bradyrhizobium sp. R2.2-H]|jgi:flagellar motor protein MotB|uniref:OmpA family protein n=1 Tax=unclassified Bradyrhizobium TaxID=2631580 RepID=UPI00104CD742|nr:MULTISPECIES: OmpA family protein [unclassified Bradyrhizobium]TCU64088.1 OmpA family protein [Bradyrhizobium sp. Y-H1]TCU65822.1 OmpA family protein [Bradyrhizobium sp. R2.2-H]